MSKAQKDAKPIVPDENFKSEPVKFTRIEKLESDLTQTQQRLDKAVTALEVVRDTNMATDAMTATDMRITAVLALTTLKEIP